MAQLQLPAEPTYRRRVYSELRGVNFSADPSLVDRRHSPDALNMISDNGGNPIKRRGWQTIINTGDDPVDNVWTFYLNGKRRIVVTYGTNMAEVKITQASTEEEDYNTATYTLGEPVTVNASKKFGFRNQSTLHDDFFVLDSDKYWYISEENDELTFNEVVPKVPTVLITRDPVNGGGVVLDDINMLTRERIEEFAGTGTATSFKLSATVDVANHAGQNKLFYRTGADTWAEDTSAVFTNGSNTVTIPTAHAEAVANQDNIRIQYFATGDDKKANILGCEAGARYAKGNMDQIFLSANESFPNYVYYSDIGDPTFFPENNYIYVGGASTKVMGFLNIGEYLAVVKEESGEDSTIFLVYSTSYQTKSTTNNGTTTTIKEYEYAIKRSTTGTGAISKRCFNVLNDEPLFLSRHGIHGMVSTAITSEKVVRNRSVNLDKKLTEEDDLENAVATVFNNYYIVVVNSKAYILDGRNKVADTKNNTNYGYEAYFWDNIPAICLATFGNELFFGTADGKVCRFKNSGQATDYSDDGKAIVARWSTPNDNDDYTEYFKTMKKKGSMCTVAPYERSSVDVFIIADSTTQNVDDDNKRKIPNKDDAKKVLDENGNEVDWAREYVGTALVDIWTGFENIDFSRFAFDTRRGPRDYFWRKKKKKYKRLQIVLENRVVDEPFGVFEIVKTYIMTRFAK